MDPPEPLDPRIVDDLALRDLARRQILARHKRNIAVYWVVAEAFTGTSMHGRIMVAPTGGVHPGMGAGKTRAHGGKAAVLASLWLQPRWCSNYDVRFVESIFETASRTAEGAVRRFVWTVNVDL